MSGERSTEPARSVAELPGEPDPLVSGRTSSRRLFRSRVAHLALLVGGGLFLLGLIWLVVTGFLVRNQVGHVRSDLHRLRTEIAEGRLDAARKTAHDLTTSARRARALTSGPAWAIGASIPYAGEPLDEIRGLTEGLDRIASAALPQLVDASRGVDPARLRLADGRFDLTPIAAASPGIARASVVVHSVCERVKSLPSGWLPFVNAARQSAVEQLVSLDRTVRNADVASRVLPSLLGVSGPRNYFLAFQSEAELRGTGGLAGAFAILHADRGRLTFIRFEPDSTLGGVPSGLHLGSDFDSLWAGAAATSDYGDSNVSPHFPYTAQIWSSMWAARSGQRVDGVLSVDPTALSYLLRVTGPVRLADHALLDADNVVAMTQQGVYARYPRNDQSEERKQYQLEIARAVSSHLLAGRPATAGLVRALARAGAERRFLVWSADPRIERQLARTSVSGVVPTARGAFAGVALNNAAANKLDYYMSAAVVRTNSGCGAQRVVTVRITLRNNTPSQVPQYVLGQTGEAHRPESPGDNRTLVSYYATSGAILADVWIDGVTSGATIGRERRHPVFSVRVDTARGSSTQIVFKLLEPGRGDGAPQTFVQPMARPMALTLRGGCDD